MKRIIVVTGASSGIGKEFALQLVQSRNCDEIWLMARRKDKLEDLAGQLAVPARVIDADLSGEQGVKRFASLLADEKKRAKDGFTIDTLVNNAGFGTYGPFADTALARQLDMISLNVVSLTGICHAALPFLARGSRVINVASLAGFIPLGNFAVYAASKAYVLSFSVALAAELADAGVFVSTVCPGPVDTEFALVASNGARERVVDGKSPDAVVRHCLRGIERGKRVSIMAAKWRFKAFMSRFVGRYFFARLTWVTDKRPSKPV